MTKVHHLAVGDEGPSLERIAYLNDEVLPLTGPVSMTLWSYATGLPVATFVAATAVLVDGPAGVVRFDWPNPNPLTAGKYLARFRALNAAGDEVSVPNEGGTLVIVSA